jgi:hypothetical protein
MSLLDCLWSINELITAVMIKGRYSYGNTLLLCRNMTFANPVSSILNLCFIVTTQTFRFVSLTCIIISNTITKQNNSNKNKRKKKPTHTIQKQTNNKSESYFSQTGGLIVSTWPNYKRTNVTNKVEYRLR